MTDYTESNNLVFLTGKIHAPFAYSHQIKEKSFYQTTIMIKRLSGYQDYIPIILCKDLINVSHDYTGQFITIWGQLRSHNCHDNGCSHLKLFVFVQEITPVKTQVPTYKNNIFLDGYLCKPPVYRLTPLKRKITDFLLAVNRSYGKSDYIPGISWNKNALELASYPVGTHLTLLGRIQSREYTKTDADGHIIQNTTCQFNTFSK